jgi:hypothetical protein
VKKKKKAKRTRHSKKTAGTPIHAPGASDTTAPAVDPPAPKAPREPDFDPRTLDPNGVGNTFCNVAAVLQGLRFDIAAGPLVPEGDWARRRMDFHRAATHALCCIDGERWFRGSVDEWRTEKVAPTLSTRFANGLERPLAVETSARKCAWAVRNWITLAGPRATLPPSDVWDDIAELHRIGEIFRVMPDAADVLRAGKISATSVVSGEQPAAATVLTTPFKPGHMQVRILRLLDKAGEKRMLTRQIAAALLTPSTLARELSELKAAGLIANIRRRGYCITPAGRLWLSHHDAPQP